MKTFYETMPLVGTNNEGREHALTRKMMEKNDQHKP